MIAINKEIEIAISNQLCDPEQQGDRVRDRRSYMGPRSGWWGAHHVTRDQQGDRDQEVIEIVIGDQVCDRDQQGDRGRDR